MNQIRHSTNERSLYSTPTVPEAEFKEFEPWLEFKPRLKYGWFHLKLYLIFQELSQRLIETSFCGI